MFFLLNFKYIEVPMSFEACCVCDKLSSNLVCSRIIVVRCINHVLNYQSYNNVSLVTSKSFQYSKNQILNKNKKKPFKKKFN